MEQKILQNISSLFSLGTLRFKSKAKGGFLSENYIVGNEDSTYFLKRYRPTVHDRLSVVQKAEQFFAAGGIPVILPIKTKNGKTHFKVNEHYYSLFPFIQGRAFSWTDTLTPRILTSIATTLASMHALSKKSYPLITNERISEWDPKKVLRSHTDFAHYAHRVLTAIQRKRRKTKFGTLAERMLRLKLSLAPSVPSRINIRSLGKDHVVHGDYHAQNVLLDADGSVTHVFDFEKSEIRPRSLEVIRSMYIICFSGWFRARNFKNARLYLQAYARVYPIKKSELKAAVLFTYYKSIMNLWIEKEYYLNHNARPAVLLEGEYRFLKYMAKHRDEFLRKLLQ